MKPFLYQKETVALIAGVGEFRPDIKYIFDVNMSSIFLGISPLIDESRLAATFLEKKLLYEA